MSNSYLSKSRSKGLHHPCLDVLLADQATQAPDAIALTAPGGATLTYRALQDQIDEVRQQLRAWGVNRQDCVALVLPQGPELAVAFLAVATTATCAPLNPAYRRDEFAYYLADLQPKALLLAADRDSPARQTAQACRIPVFDVLSSPGAAGRFTLYGEQLTPAVAPLPARPDDVALVLHTSGTTGRPKKVPLRHRNLCASAQHIRQSLDLRDHDRCLNVMPLFHIHGLIGALVASLAAGASVICPPEFSAVAFFDWMAACRPTWYTAVPTMHQAILHDASQHRERITACPLRLIRSSSSALPSQVMTALEDVFQAPVIEAYGMTEAAHQIASNPLPPQTRKPGSVGLATGTDIAIMDTAGRLLPPGASGEIVIRGANVMQGYAEDDEANADTFVDGWLRTGDQGVLDADGYLYLMGRFKEIINRGGETIAPREIEDVLLEHEAIAQAVAFAAPHPTLGEDVAVAVVLRDHAVLSEQAIRQCVATRLTAFKVPSHVLIVDDIPKGPTGKLQRIGLADRFGLAIPEYVAPRTPLQKRLAQIWAEVLGLDRVGICSSFFQLGGDSLRAARLFARIEQTFGKPLSVVDFFQASTVEEQSRLLSRQHHTASFSSVVAIQPDGTKPPFFCVHSHVGDVLSFRHLAAHLGPDQPFYGLRSLGLYDDHVPLTHIDDMAAHYVRDIRSVQPQGPYFLGGDCFGGFVALEMAQQLFAQGQQVAFMALIDTHAPGCHDAAPFVRRLRYRTTSFLQRLKQHANRMAPLAPHAKVAYLRNVAKRFVNNGIAALVKRGRRRLGWEPRVITPEVSKPTRIALINRQAQRVHTPRVYPGRLLLFRVHQVNWGYEHEPHFGWDRLAAGGVECHVVPAEGYMMTERFANVLAKTLRPCLDKAQARIGASMRRTAIEAPNSDGDRMDDGSLKG